jgi:hypothetical protein
MAVFWNVAPCSLGEVYRNFRVSCCLHRQGIHLPDDGQTTHRNISEDTYLYIRRRKNPKSHVSLSMLAFWLTKSCETCRQKATFQRNILPPSSAHKTLQPISFLHTIRTKCMNWMDSGEIVPVQPFKNCSALSFSLFHSDILTSKF